MNIKKRQLKYIPGTLALTEGRRVPLVTDPGNERKQVKRPWITRNLDDGSIELVVIGMLAALIVLLAIPLFSGFEHGAKEVDRPAPEQVEETASNRS